MEISTKKKNSIFSSVQFQLSLWSEENQQTLISEARSLHSLSRTGEDEHSHISSVLGREEKTVHQSPALTGQSCTSAVGRQDG